MTDVPFARFVAALALRPFSGILRVDGGGQKHAVYFQDGGIVDADAACDEDGLCQVALDAGLVTLRGVAEVRRRAAELPARSEKDLLIEAGALGGEALERALATALTQRAMRIFAPADAEVQVEEVAHGRQGGGPVDARRVVYRGVRRHYDERRLARELRGLAGHAIELAVDRAAIFDAFGFGNQELIVLRGLATKQWWQLAELIDECIAVPRRVVLAVIHALRAFEYLNVEPRGRRLAVGTEPPVGAAPAAETSVTAEEQFRRGESALRQLRYIDAAAAFRAAVALDDANPDYHAFLGWSTWCAAPRKDVAFAEVSGEFAKAVRLGHGRCVPALYFLGLVHDARGDREKAHGCFAKVVALDADHLDAARRLEAIERRR